MVRFDRYQALNDEEPTRGQEALRRAGIDIVNSDDLGGIRLAERALLRQHGINQQRAGDDARIIESSSPGGGGGSLESWEDESRSAFIPRYRHTASRYIVTAVGALLLAASVALALLAVVQRRDRVIPICLDCSTVVTIMFAACGACGGLSLWAFAGSFWRRRCLAYPLAAIFVLLAMACLVIAVVTTIIEAGGGDVDLRRLWTLAVSEDPDMICSLQLHLHCSGFDTSCNTNTNNNTSTPSTPSASPVTTSATQHEQCSPLCGPSNNFVQPCGGPFHQELLDNLLPVVIASYATALMFVAGAIASVRMTKSSAQGLL